MAVGDVYRITFSWKDTPTSGSAINTFYFEQLDGLIFDTPGEDLWEAFQNDCFAEYQATIASYMELYSVAVGVEPDFFTEFLYFGVGEAGTLGGGDAQPALLAGVLSRYTANLTRRGKGRVFLGPVVESVNAGGAPTTGHVTTIQDFGDAQLPNIGDAITTARWSPSHWSKEDQTAYEITQWIARRYWGTQRDRRTILG